MAKKLTAIFLSMCIIGCSGGDDTNDNNENQNTAPVCGNGVLEAGELCDDGPNNSDLAPNACRTNCRDPYCGDGVIDGGEECDTDQLASNSCVGLGYTKGTLACSATCEYDTSDCSTCGDDNAEGTDTASVGYETCDGSDLRGQDCISIGQATGDLRCNSSCEWDISGCIGSGAVCGNGVKEGDEECDDNNATACDGCSPLCKVERCGNGVVECGEQCDDGAQNSDTADSCRTDCTNPVCGDGIKDTTEVCDGTDFGAPGAQTCDGYYHMLDPSDTRVWIGTMLCPTQNTCQAVNNFRCSVCGNGLCESGAGEFQNASEDQQNCPQDCNVPTCDMDGVCEPANGENWYGCGADCY
jgi:cysteine-rich repeat protein